jgi:hypothetical protein
MSRKLLLVGAALVAAGVLLKRDKVAGLLPGRGQTYTPPEPHTPGPSNYDAPGPVANTATPVPAPEGQEPGPIDEGAEEAAAAAEAANIGGVVSDYAGPAGERADEAERPLAEAGQGEAEGQEQAEDELRAAAEPTAPGMSGEQRQVEEAIEQAANPLAGEQVEPLRSPDDTARDAEPLRPASAAPAEPPAEAAPPEPSAPTEPTAPTEPSAPTEPARPAESSAWSPPVPERTDEPAPFEAPQEPSEPGQYEPPTQEQPAVRPEGDEEKKDEEGGSDWRTWSGRSVNP